VPKKKTKILLHLANFNRFKDILSSTLSYELLKVVEINQKKSLDAKARKMRVEKINQQHLSSFFLSRQHK
jgi:hypothetical protein